MNYPKNLEGKSMKIKFLETSNGRNLPSMINYTN